MTTELLTAALVTILPLCALDPDRTLGKTEALPDSVYGFSTARYDIQMRVSFPAPYEGKRLSVYHSADPAGGDCLAARTGVSRCIDGFVGALAVVTFAVTRADNGKAAAASIREAVTVVEQSPGMAVRPPFTMTIKLVGGIGSDLQAFGYDETPVPEVKRAAEREAAKATWRRYRQELYLDKDRQPFAVVDWLHTTTRIRILRLDAPSSPSANRR